MPELPEVETVKNQLKLELIGKRIEEVKVYTPKIIKHPELALFQTNVKKEEFIDIKRRGKWLILELSNYDLIVHLRMEGKFFLKSKTESYNKHEHVIFKLSNGLELRYHDIRMFGEMYLLKKDKINNFFLNKKLGLEPFTKELTVLYLKDKFKGKTQPIKSTLLEQDIIAGIGNIYANEILFRVGINPKKVTKELTNVEIELIIKEMRKILQEAIKLGGTSIHTYTSLDQKKGSYQEKLLVHGRKDLLCFRCNTKINKIKINGRGTYFCPKCQK